MESKGPTNDAPHVASPSAHSPPPPAWLGEIPKRPDPLKELVEWVKSVLWSTGFISFIFMLLLSFIIVLAMTPDIQQWITTPQPLENDPATLELPMEVVFIITPWPIYLLILQGISFQAWHFLMLGILFSAFAYAKYELFGSWLSRKDGAIRSLRSPQDATSSLEGVAKLFMACMFFSMMYFLFLDMINVQMKSPDFSTMPTAELIYRLFSASVFEELISRVLLVGVPLAIIGLVKGWGRPEKSLLGGGMGLNPTTLILILFSGTIFAFAHVGSWDLWKVPQVLIPGFALGWAFVRYGLHASMLIHFSINLSTSAMEIWPDSIPLTILLGLAILIWVVAGGYFFLHYCIEFVVKISPRKRMQKWATFLRYKPRKKIAPYWIWMIRHHMRKSLRSFHVRYNIKRSKKHKWKRKAPQIENSKTEKQNIRSQLYREHGQSYVPQPSWASPTGVSQPLPNPYMSQIPGGFICPNCGNMTASYDSGKLICLKCGTAQFKDGTPEKKEEKVQIEF